MSVSPIRPIAGRDPYAGQWVAAKDCRIIASGPTMDDMLRELGDVDLQTVVLHYIRRPAWTIYR